MGDRRFLSIIFGGLLITVAVVLLGFFVLSRSPERLGKVPPTSSQLVVCDSSVYNCPDGHYRVYFGTTLIEVSWDRSVFRFRDVTGDVRGTGRTIRVTSDGKSWSEINQIADVTPTEVEIDRVAASFNVEEKGQSLHCTASAPKSKHSVGFILGCDR